MLRMLLLLLFAIPAAAQLTESIEVHVLEVEANVLGRGNKPVEDLTAADFEVRVDGKLVPVTNFYLVKRGTIVEQPSEAAGSQPAESAAQTIPTRLVLFIDDLHLHQRAKKRVMAALHRFVEKTLDHATTAMIVRWTGSLEVIVPATSDRTALLAAIDRMATQPSRMRELDSDRRSQVEIAATEEPDVALEHIKGFAEKQASETRATIGALMRVTRAVSGLSGRRVILQISEGLPLFAGWETLALIYGDRIPPDVMQYDQSQVYLELTKFAQRSGVVLCPFDPSGPDGPRYTVDIPDGNPNPDLIRENNRNTMTLLARETGGQVIADTNLLDAALAEVTDNVTTYYSLGVSAPSGSRGPYKIAVRVRNHPGARVVTAPRRSVHTREEMIEDGVRSRLYLREETNPLDAHLAAGTPRVDGTHCVADVHLSVNPAKLTLIPNGSVSFHFAVLDDRDQESPLRSTFREIAAGARAVEQDVTLALKPRKYLVSAAVVDKLSGEISYLQSSVDATVCSRTQ